MSAEKRVLSLVARRALFIAAGVGVVLGVGVVVLGVPSTISAAALVMGTSALVRRFFG